MYLQGLEENTRYQNAVQRRATLPDLQGDARFLTLGSGRRLAYSEYGDLQGFPLLYLHSHGSSRLEGLFFHDSARAAGFRLIAIDRPGLGLSDFKHCRHGHEYVDDLLTLADHLKIESFALLSWSGGAEFAFDTSRIACSRVKFQLCLAPLSTRLEHDLRNPVLEFLLACLWSTVIRLRCHFAMRWSGPLLYLERLHQHVGQADRRVLENARIRSILERNLIEAAATGCRGIAQDVCRSVRSRQCVSASVDVPVVIWQGTADALTSPLMSQRLVDALPDAVMHRVPSQGHFGFLQDSREILASARRQFLMIRPAGRMMPQVICPEEPEQCPPMFAGVRK